jgi:NADPH:quinone reductase-like Zn-dependent oxidoreductase
MTSSRHYALVKGQTVFSLAKRSRELPALLPNQILIRIKAASLNYRDLLTFGDPDGSKDGLIPLSDAAGEVIAVGLDVKKWKLGDRVSPGFFPAWTDGAFSQVHLTNALGGGQTDGVLSEYVIADETAVVAIPDHLSFAEAAALPCAGVTAWHALFERGGLQPGQTVLVQGTGGVALLGLQFASAVGAKVIVISSSDEKLERATKLGAWQTINYNSHPDWDRVALELTDGQGVDHILELGGPATYDRSIAAIAPGGQIAQIGVLSGFGSRPDMTPLQFKNAAVNGICVGSIEHYANLNRFLAKHRIHPVIDTDFSFGDAGLAYDKLRSAGHFGKITISVD